MKHKRRILETLEIMEARIVSLLQGYARATARTGDQAVARGRRAGWNERSREVGEYLERRGLKVEAEFVRSGSALDDLPLDPGGSTVEDFASGRAASDISEGLRRAVAECRAAAGRGDPDPFAAARRIARELFPDASPLGRTTNEALRRSVEIVTKRRVQRPAEVVESIPGDLAVVRMKRGWARAMLTEARKGAIGLPVSINADHWREIVDVLEPLVATEEDAPACFEPVSEPTPAEQGEAAARAENALRTAASLDGPVIVEIGQSETGRLEETRARFVGALDALARFVGALDALARARAQGILPPSNEVEKPEEPSPVPGNVDSPGTSEAPADKADTPDTRAGTITCPECGRSVEWGPAVGALRVLHHVDHRNGRTCSVAGQRVALDRDGMPYLPDPWSSTAAWRAGSGACRVCRETFGLVRQPGPRGSSLETVVMAHDRRARYTGDREPGKFPPGWTVLCEGSGQPPLSSSPDGLAETPPSPLPDCPVCGAPVTVMARDSAWRVRAHDVPQGGERCPGTGAIWTPSGFIPAPDKAASK